ncbi:MAG TPA: MalY/PatB family protein [Paracoccaceae bacterium]|nr:MalY/PatB family protein [Paracoccaceae bacterium]
MTFAAPRASDFDFDEIVDRRGSRCAKWDKMEALYGVSPDDGIAMWVADMDFKAPPSVREALQRTVDHGVFGYFGDDSAYKAAIQAWMKARHGWEVDPAWLSTTHGLVSGTALSVQAFSEPGDGVILFTPVYHAFHKVLNANRRRIVQSELVEREGRYEMDLEALAARLDGSERMVILCSPHNPGGRVWDVAELRALAEFCAEHDLILVSDEIHADLVMPGAPRHTVANLAAPEHVDRIVTLAASTKTFNIAGAMTGGVYIQDPSLRARFQAVHLSVGASPNAMGMIMATAAYEGGAPWLDALIPYLDANRRAFDAAVNAIPGVRSMPLEATYLAWVDFSGTGMSAEEFTRRVEKGARIAVNRGPTFGKGGETWLRFNLATPRSRVEEAGARLQEAFSDLQ